MVDAAASVVFEILDVFVFRCLPVEETGSHAYAIKGHLFEAVDNLRRLDAQDVIERGSDIVDLIKLRTRDGVMLDVPRPRNDQRVPCATEVGGDQLGAMKWRRARPSPTGVIHAVSLRADLAF